MVTGCHSKQACLDSKHETGTCLANSVWWEGPVRAAVRGFSTSNLRYGQAGWDSVSNHFLLVASF